MVWPNACRSLTYSVAYMSAPSARPMPRAATMGRMALSPSMASRKPPTSPMTFSAGTCTSCSRSSPVSTPRTPILWSGCPTSTPSQARSTMNAVMESWSREVDVVGRLGEHRVPVGLRHARHPALGAVEHPAAGEPSGTALVRMPMTSLPAWGSDRPKAARFEPSAMPRQVALASGRRVPAIMTGPGGQAGEQQHEGRRVGVLGHLLDGDGEPEDARRPSRRGPRGCTARAGPASRKTSKRSCGYSPVVVDLPAPAA